MIVNIFVIIITLVLGFLLLERGNSAISRKRYVLKHLNKTSVWEKFVKYHLEKINNDRKWYIIIICTVLVLQSGLRHVAVGSDTYSYYLHFEKVKNLDWGKIYSVLINHYSTGEGKDPGYLVFQKVAQYITPFYQLYLFLIAIIFFSAFGYFLYKNTKKISDLIFAFVLYSCLFYSFFSITGHRQTIATAGTLWGYEFIKRKKLVPFLIILLLASTIHKSCLIFIPFYFIAQIRKTNLLLVVVTFFPILFVFSSKIAGLIQSFSNDYDEYKHFENLQPVTFTVMMLLIGISASLFYKKSVIKDSQSVHYFNAFALAIFFTSLVFAVHGYMRIVQYYSIYMILLIPLVFKSIENQVNRTRELIFGFCVFFLITMSIRANWDAEYKFFWQKMKLGSNYKNTNYYYR